MFNPPEPPREPFDIVQRVRELLAAEGIACETEYREEVETRPRFDLRDSMEPRTKCFDVTLRFRLDAEHLRYTVLDWKGGPTDASR